MSRRALLMVVGVLLVGTDLRAQDGYKVVVNPANGISSLSKEQVSRLFQGRTAWDDGSAAAPIDLQPASPVREAFSRDIFGVPPSAMAPRTGAQPPTVASDRDVLAYVRLKPGSIGYVSASADVQGVKVVAVGKVAAASLPLALTADMPAPEKLVGGDPVYPQVARTARVQGSVDVMVVIGTTGSVEQARVLHSIPMLDDAAIAAVKKWKYRPTVVNGVAVQVSMMVRVNFSL